MDLINKLVWQHILAEPGIIAGIAVFFTNIDRIILFALRFFSPETIKTELDRINAAAKKEVDKVATQAPKA